ncbi:TonB-dependent receptor [Pontibaca methylaminivorans]|uniref:TonB-dependent receptor n=1 Tax=Pontibaca methylaminivorans TaxID=515897 RepID=UPI002FDB4823
MATMHNRRPGPRALGLLLSLTTALPVLAQESAPEGAPQYLDTITVTSTGLPTEVLKNPASITVVDGEELRRTAPLSVAKLLRDVPGVRISEEGIERISIRGESARRVAIMIDGQKLTDHTNYGQPVLIDPASIERIEIVRGSSSVTSGSQAIGGVVNIITRKGAAEPFELTTTAGYISATEGWRASATAAGTVDAGAGEFDYRLTFGRMRQGDRHTPNGILDQSATSDRTVSGHLGYRMGRHYVGVTALGYDLSANVPTGDPEFIIELPKRDLRKVGLFYEGTDLTPWLERLRLDVYRQTIDRLFRNDVTVRPAPMTLNVVSASRDRQLTWGASLRAEMRFSDRTRTVVGLEYEDDRLEADKDTITTVSGPMLPFPSVSTRLRYDDAVVRTTSIFGQHEIDLGRDLTLTLGGRWYNVKARHETAREDGVDLPRESSSDSLALFSAGLVWSPDDSLALRANVSQGYIYPSLGQLFLSTTAGGEGTTIGNPALEPERATTYELGARYDFGGLLLDSTLFYSNARNYIASMVIDASDPRNVISQYRNVDRAKTWGLELHAEYDLAGQGLTPYVTAAAMRREFSFANGYSTTDSGTPALSGRIGLRKDWALTDVYGEVDLFVRGETRVRMRDETAGITDRTGGYGTLNLHGSMTFANDVTAVIELNNITNRTYRPYGEMTGAGRSVNLFLTRTF